MPQTNNKNNGVVYTPNWIVNEILNLADYKTNIYNKKVLEPGCGDDAFLVQILERMIIDAKNHNIENSKISNIIEENIYAIDIDKLAIERCKIRLNDVCKKHGIRNQQWKNIIKENLLSQDIIENYRNKFDFVIGNPPYVRIQNLNTKTREFINSNLKLCNSGSTDIYIAFFELGLAFLNATGRLGYITPSSFTSSMAGRNLRKFLSSQNKIEKIVDFEEHQVFENATTYSLITIYNNHPSNSMTSLYKGNTRSIKRIGEWCVSDFGENKWVFEDTNILSKIEEIKSRGQPLGKIAQIHTGLATLKDDLFIYKNVSFNGDVATIYLKDNIAFEIEKNILKRIIKASTWKSSNDNQNMYIIFPYKNINGKNTIIPEDEMKKYYPLTYHYFQTFKKELNERDKGKPNPVSWYAFGRSQGLDSSFGKKIITAPINLQPRFIVCEDDSSTYYAGYSIHYDGDLYKLAEQLNSEDMKFYINYVSKDYQNGYKSYSKSFIKDFGIDL